MRWRPFLGLVFASTAVAGVASAGGSRTPTPGSLLAPPGPDVNLVMGTSDYATGDVRISFLVLDPQARSIERPLAHVWLAHRLGTAVIEQATARLLSIDPGGGPENVSHVYVGHLRIRHRGATSSSPSPRVDDRSRGSAGQQPREGAEPAGEGVALAERAVDLAGGV